MKTLTTALISGCLALAGGISSAQDTVKKEGAASAPSLNSNWTVKDCKDYMAMPKKDGMNKDEAMKKDAECAEIMKKGDTSVEQDPMKKERDATAGEKVKKDWTVKKEGDDGQTKK